MTDIVTYCDVNTCEECPRYGDDCDGDKRVEHTDLISRADAIEAVAQEWLSEASAESPYVNDDDIGEYRKLAEKLFEDVPSADAVSREFYEDAVKANIRIVMENCELKEQIESAEAVQGEWEFVDNEIFAGEYFCSICGKRAEVDLYGEWILSNYCPSCGAIMKGGAE